MFQKAHSLAIPLAAALLCLAQAGATPITNPYSGQGPSAGSTALNNWKAALTGSSTMLDFTTLTGTETSPKTLGGFTFSGFSAVVNQEFDGSNITITPPSGGETAIFLFVNDQSGRDTASSFTLTLSDGEASGSIPLSVGPSGAEYYGFTTSSPITSVVLAASSGTLSIGELWYGTAQGSGGTEPTPEAATILLTAGGFFLLFGCQRKLFLRKAF